MTFERAKEWLIDLEYGITSSTDGEVHGVHLKEPGGDPVLATELPTYFGALTTAGVIHLGELIEAKDRADDTDRALQRIRDLASEALA